MKFLKNRKTTSNKAADTAAGWMAACIQRLQQKWAKAMSKLFSRLSPAWAKAVVVCCAVLTIAYSTVLVASAFDKPVKAFANTGFQFKLPPAIKPKVVPKALPDNMVARIKRFRFYLDSLATTESGRRQRDSLLKNRPGLLDSLQQIENIYCR